MAYSPTKKKKSSAKTIIPASPSASTPFSSTLVDSSVLNSEGSLSLPDFERSDLGPRHSEPEPIVLSVINESEVEEGMEINLRVDFKERHHKRLHEAIEVDASPAKRTCLEGEPMKDAFPMLVPLPNAAGSSNVLVAGKETCSTQDGALGGPAPVKEDLDQKDAFASVSHLSWEEMMGMLRRVPCFTNVEPPLTKMLDFFSLTKRILVNMGGDPPVFVSARLPFGTLESTISPIQQLQDYTVQETTKVVIFSVFLLS